MVKHRLKDDIGWTLSRQKPHSCHQDLVWDVSSHQSPVVRSSARQEFVWILQETKEFQAENSHSFLTRKSEQNTDSRLDCVSSDLVADGRLEMPGMLDCFSIGDHVPLIGYWWAEPRGQCPRWVPTQWEQDIYDSWATEKMKGSHSGRSRLSFSHWLRGSALRLKKRFPHWTQPGCPI